MKTETCRHCDGQINYIEYSQWNGAETELLDAWWAHEVHPADGHDAAPAFGGVA